MLSQGRLYLTSAVEDQSGGVSLRAICVEAEHGEIVWNVEVFQPAPNVAAQRHSKNGLASPTPVVTSDRLYVHFGHLGTAALDLDGNVLWRETLRYRPVHGNGGSPALAGDRLVVSCDGGRDPFVAALACATGDVLWKRPRNVAASKTFSFSTPTVIEVNGSQQIISVGSGIVAAYAPQDGREIWRVTFDDGYSIVPRPVFAHGLLLISTGYDRPRILAVKPQGAAGDATDSHVVWTHERGAPLTPSMIVVGNELYFVSDNGVASCADARTGRLHWTKRLGGDFSASPVSAEDRLYFLNEEGVTYVVRSATEFELLATNDLQERTLASPVVADGAIYVRSEPHLWRIRGRK